MPVTLASDTYINVKNIKPVAEKKEKCKKCALAFGRNIQRDSRLDEFYFFPLKIPCEKNKQNYST